jgi:hypothetical protein
VAVRARGRGIFPIHPFIHSFKKEPRFVCARAIWHGEGSESIRSQEPPHQSQEMARGSAGVGRRAAKTRRFLKTQLMLFGIGLCQNFDDPDLGQEERPSQILLSLGPLVGEVLYVHASVVALICILWAYKRAPQIYCRFLIVGESCVFV